MAQPATFGDTYSAYFNYIWDHSFRMLSQPSFSNPYYILLSVYIVAFVAESVLPKLKKYAVVGRKGFFTDLIYLVFIDFALGVFGFSALTYTIEYFFLHGTKNAGIHLPLFDLHTLPFVFKFLIFFVLMDFFQFLAHFLLHRISFMWAFHKIHHAQEELGFASTRHLHFGEYLVLRPVGWIPLALIGMNAEELLLCFGIYMWIGFSFVFFSHCNVKLPLGWLNYIFINPNTHYWHHAKNIPGRYGNNFASVLNIWDILFGTFYLPKDEKLEPILGVPDQEEVPPSFLGQMIYPFKILFRNNSPQSAGTDFRNTVSRQEKRQMDRQKKKEH